MKHGEVTACNNSQNNRLEKCEQRALPGLGRCDGEVAQVAGLLTDNFALKRMYVASEAVLGGSDSQWDELKYMLNAPGMDGCKNQAFGSKFQFAKWRDIFWTI